VVDEGIDCELVHGGVEYPGVRGAGPFADMGAESFAERARRELLATDQKVRKRSVETSDELTAQAPGG
jgi:hypothetical protein